MSSKPLPTHVQVVSRGARQCRGSAGRADGHLQPAVRELHPAAAAAGAATGQRGGEKGRFSGEMCCDAHSALQVHQQTCVSVHLKQI